MCMYHLDIDDSHHFVKVTDKVLRTLCDAG